MRTITGFADFYKDIRPIARLQVLSRRSGFFLKRKKQQQKTSIIVCFMAFTFFLGSDNFAAMYLLHL